MLGDLRIDRVIPQRLELKERVLFVSAHQAAITYDIRR
jgi:hypothetical protein